MTGPTLIECVKLHARLTPMACLQNRLTALAYARFPNIGPGLLTPCVKCEVGRKIKAFLPAGDQ